MTERIEREKESYKDKIEKDKYESSFSSSSQLDHSPCRSPAKKSYRSSKAVVINAEVAAALDRSQMSKRGAMAVLVPLSSGLGSNVEELSLSASAIHRHQRIHREAKAPEIKESSPTVPLNVRWDGKLMPALTNREVVERLPILVSGEGNCKLLPSPVTDGKAEPTATTVMTVISEWNLQDRIAALCSDTTATSTGPKGGVCLRLQQILGRDLLNLACRYHVFELLLAAVFSALVPESSQSPDITIFLTIERVLALCGHNRLSDGGRCHPLIFSIFVRIRYTCIIRSTTTESSLSWSLSFLEGYHMAPEASPFESPGLCIEHDQAFSKN